MGHGLPTSSSLGAGVCMLACGLGAFGTDLVGVLEGVEDATFFLALGLASFFFTPLRNSRRNRTQQKSVESLLARHALFEAFAMP